MPAKYIYLIVSLFLIVLTQCSKDEVQLTTGSLDPQEDLKKVTVYRVHTNWSISELLDKLDPRTLDEDRIDDLFVVPKKEKFEPLNEEIAKDLCFSMIKHDSALKIYSADFLSLKRVMNASGFTLKSDEFIAYKDHNLYCYLHKENERKMKLRMLHVISEYEEQVSITRHMVEVSLVHSESEITLATIDVSKTKEIFRAYQTIRNPQLEEGLSDPQIDFEYVLKSGEDIRVRAMIRDLNKNVLVPVSSTGEGLLYAHCKLHTHQLKGGFHSNNFKFEFPYVKAEKQFEISERLLRAFKFRVSGDFFRRMFGVPMPNIVQIPEAIKKIHQLHEGAVGFALGEFLECSGIKIPKGGHAYFCASTNEVIYYANDLTHEQISRVFAYLGCTPPKNSIHQMEFIEVPLPNASTPLDQIDYTAYEVVDGFDLIGRAGENTIFSNPHSLIRETVFTTMIGTGDESNLLLATVALSYRDTSYSPEQTFYYYTEEPCFIPLIKYPEKETLIVLKLTSVR